MSMKTIDTRKNVRIGYELGEDMAAFCRDRGIIIQAFVEMAIREHLRRSLEKEEIIRRSRAS
jgi:hypothetical protein